MGEAHQAGRKHPFDLSAQAEELVFRSESTSPARLAETLVSLANAGGGTLLLGVDPRTGKAHDLADPDEALDRALQSALAADPPLIIPLPQVIEIDGERVLAITVPPGLPHVYSYRGKYLVREGTHTRPLNPRQLRRLMMERGAVSFESEVPDGARLDDVDWEKASRYLNSLEGWHAGDAQEALLRRGCLARAGDDVRPTYAGLLLFGREPQRWVPSAEILVARYSGRTMEDTFVKEEVRGTLPDQIRQAEAFVVANMRRGVRLVGLERVEEAEYPAEAVREAIVNAVAHRDYQVRGDEIRVFLFADRVEFYSPGRLPGHVTVENLVRERFSRNEIVVQILSDMGFIERLGYGIDRMIRLMAESGLAEPRFEETVAGFRVTLAGRGEGLVGIEPAAGQWRHLGLNERQEKALACLMERGRITNRDLQELAPDVSAETIRRDLADMVDKNLLLKIGEKRATYYILK
ncbi:MAG: putative DNA binding domain-containing protein [Anaerolineae bacterium]|nr:putative DNA binding domain-containing protein [Anaerolineae bacterium]